MARSPVPSMPRSLGQTGHCSKPVQALPAFGSSQGIWLTSVRALDSVCEVPLFLLGPVPVVSQHFSTVSRVGLQTGLRDCAASAQRRVHERELLPRAARGHCCALRALLSSTCCALRGSPVQSCLRVLHFMDSRCFLALVLDHAQTCLHLVNGVERLGARSD